MKTWSLTLYQHGRPIGTQRHLSEHDVATEIYRLTSHTTTPVEELGQASDLRAETGELSLAA